MDLYARTVMTKKLNVMVRKIEGVTSFVLTGNDVYTPGEIYYVVAAADDSALSKVLADLNFLIREFLRPIDIQKKESEGRTLVNYVFDNGLKAQIVICNENHLPAFEWWMPYMDKNGAAQGFYPPSTRKTSDPTTEDQRPEEENADDFDEGLADSADKPVAPAEFQPAVSAPVRDSRPEKQDKDIWNSYLMKHHVRSDFLGFIRLIFMNALVDIDCMSFPAQSLSKPHFLQVVKAFVTVISHAQNDKTDSHSAPPDRFLPDGGNWRPGSIFPYKHFALCPGSQCRSAWIS